MSRRKLKGMHVTIPATGSMKSIRILCVTPYYKPAYVYGGPARSVPALCEAMVESGASVTVFTTNVNGPGKTLGTDPENPVDVNGVKVHYFPLAPIQLPLPFYSRTLGTACKDMIGEFDVVYICGSWTYPLLASARAARRLGVPYVVSPRGSFMSWSMSQKPLKKRLYLALVERRLLDSAAAIHCTSRLERDQLECWQFKPPTMVIPNGVDEVPFRDLPVRGRLRESLGIPPSGTLSLFVGRLHKMKRVDLMIDSFATFARHLEHAHLAIVGPEGDGYGKKAMERVKQLGLMNRIHFFGMLTGSSLTQTYADADMLVLVSHRENFGMVVAEAMFAGLPVLVAKGVGLAEEVSQAGAGCVIQADRGEISRVWQEMLVGADLRAAMAEKGQVFAEEHFSAAAVAHRMLHLLESVSIRSSNLTQDKRGEQRV